MTRNRLLCERSACFIGEYSHIRYKRETVMRVLLGITLIGVAVLVLCGVIVVPVLPPTQDNATVNN